MILVITSIIFKQNDLIIEVRILRNLIKEKGKKITLFRGFSLHIFVFNLFEMDILYIVSLSV